jgi:hypothetical protein
VPLAYWDYSIEDQGLWTHFKVMGVMARIPGCPTVLGGSTLLTSGLGPHSQCVGCHVAWMVKRSRRLARHA